MAEAVGCTVEGARMAIDALVRAHQPHAVLCPVCGLLQPNGASTQGPAEPLQPGEPTECLLDHGPQPWLSRLRRWLADRYGLNTPERPYRRW